MKKILLSVVIVLLLVLGIATIVKGIQIGDFRINSIKEIGENSKTLDGKVQEVNTLIDVQYPSKQEELKTAVRKMQQAKEDYLNEISYTSNEELASTLEIKNFDIERIWAKVGNYATDQGVNISLSLSQKSTTGARNMHFTVTGTYVAQTNFLYAIEDDPELNYRIYNYKLSPKEGNILEATFAIKETVITKSLNDDLNGHESIDPQVKDKIFNDPTDAVNGKLTGAEVEQNTQENTETTSATPTEGESLIERKQREKEERDKTLNEVTNM